MPVQNRPPNWLFPLLVFAAALAVRLAAIAFWRFDGLYGQDAFAYYDQSVAIADRLVNGWSALPAFFWPHGYPILGALTMVVFGEGPVGPQLLNVLFGSLLAVVVYFFARDMCRSLIDDARAGFPLEASEWCGLIAGLSTASAGQVVLSSVVVMSDVSAAFWLTLSAWLVWRFWREPEPWWWFPAAAAAGAAAVVTRRASMLALPAIAAVAAVALGRLRRPRVAVLLALAVALIVVAPEFWLLESFDSADTYLLDWHPLNALASSFETVHGIQNYRFPNGLFYTAPFWHPVLMPPTMGVFAVLGLTVLWNRQRAGLALIGGWYATASLFMIGMPQQNLRFCLTLWTPAVILVALGAVAAWHRWRRITVALVAVSVVVAVVCNLWWWNRFMESAQEARFVAERVATHLPERGRVLAFGITGAVGYYTGAEVFELYNLDQQTLARVSDGARPTLVVVNRGEIERRWMDHPPGVHLGWLERERTLTVVDEIGPWSISRVGHETAKGWVAR